MEILDYNFNTEKWGINSDVSQEFKFWYNEKIEPKNEDNKLTRIIVFSY